MPIRVLIAEDHPIARRSLRLFLELDPDLTVVGEAFNGEMALGLAHELEPDVVVMDLLMPLMDGIAATEALRQSMPRSVVLGITSAMDDSLVAAAIEAGAVACLLKNADPLQLRQAIKTAAGRRSDSDRASVTPDSPDVAAP